MIPDFNRPEVYDHIRKAPIYRNERGDLCRYVRIAPDDREDPTEPRQILVTGGAVRVGFDPRTHNARLIDGEIIVTPRRGHASL
jgi:hypothetical protein